MQDARGRIAKIDAHNTAFTDGPGDQAKYDLAVESKDVLGEAPGFAYDRSGLSKKKYYVIKHNGGLVLVPEKLGRRAYVNLKDIESLSKMIAGAQHSLRNF